MLLDIVDKGLQYAVQILRSKTGVIQVDRLEGHPNIIVLVEAPNRQALAEVIMPVLDCIGGITEDLQLLVTPDNGVLPEFPALDNHCTVQECETITTRKGSMRLVI